MRTKLEDFELNQSLTSHKVSERATRIVPFHVMEIMRLAEVVEARGQDVIHLELGEPSFSTPSPIVEAGKKALEDGLTHYTRAIGIDLLRKEVARYYQESMNVDLDWHRVAITAGASSGLLMALTALLDTQDEILLTDPGYPCYPNYVELLGSQYRFIELLENDGFVLTKTLVEKYWQKGTRALLLASPSNPTGACIPQVELLRIADYVRQQKGALIVDEIYQGLNYGRQSGVSSILQVADDAIVTNSFSKFFGMTGWRIGWSVLPESLMSTFEKIAQNLTISPNTISQFAALKAFSPETLAIAEERRQAFEQRKSFLVTELKRLGFGIQLEPQGAFYIYANIDAFSNDSHDFCIQLMEQTGVALTPGLDFSPSQPKRFVRFSYTADMEQLKEAVKRIEGFLSTL
jgi:aspartate/methionine/tyrosine aminotransferase